MRTHADARNEAVFRSLDLNGTDFEIACKVVDYMLAEHGHVGNMVIFVARATPGVRVPINREGWQIEPPYDTPACRAWMIDVLLAGHSISVWYDDDYEEPTLNLGTVTAIREHARQRREAEQ